MYARHSSKGGSQAKRKIAAPVNADEPSTPAEPTVDVPKNNSGKSNKPPRVHNLKRTIASERRKRKVLTREGWYNEDLGEDSWELA